jgi:hypothetical protein
MLSLYPNQLADKNQASPAALVSVADCEHLFRYLQSLLRGLPLCLLFATTRMDPLAHISRIQKNLGMDKGYSLLRRVFRRVVDDDALA